MRGILEEITISILAVAALTILLAFFWKAVSTISLYKDAAALLVMNYFTSAVSTVFLLPYDAIFVNFSLPSYVINYSASNISSLGNFYNQTINVTIQEPKILGGRKRNVTFEVYYPRAGDLEEGVVPIVLRYKSSARRVEYNFSIFAPAEVYVVFPQNIADLHYMQTFGFLLRKRSKNLMSYNSTLSLEYMPIDIVENRTYIIVYLDKIYNKLVELVDNDEISSEDANRILSEIKDHCYPTDKRLQDIVRSILGGGAAEILEKCSEIPQPVHGALSKFSQSLIEEEYGESECEGSSCFVIVGYSCSGDMCYVFYKGTYDEYGKYSGPAIPLDVYIISPDVKKDVQYYGDQLYVKEVLIEEIPRRFENLTLDEKLENFTAYTVVPPYNDSAALSNGCYIGVIKLIRNFTYVPLSNVVVVKAKKSEDVGRNGICYIYNIEFTFPAYIPIISALSRLELSVAPVNGTLPYSLSDRPPASGVGECKSILPLEYPLVERKNCTIDYRTATITCACCRMVQNLTEGGGLIGVV